MINSFRLFLAVLLLHPVLAAIPAGHPATQKLSDLAKALA